MVELVDHVRLGRPEAAREFQKLARRQFLSAEHEHLAGEERFLDFTKSAVGEGPGEIDAARLQREIPAQFFQLQHRGLCRLNPPLRPKT